MTAKTTAALDALRNWARGRGLENHRPLACVRRLPRGPYSGLVTHRIVASRLVRQGKE
jgi:hypothetical protein